MKMVKNQTVVTRAQELRSRRGEQKPTKPARTTGASSRASSSVPAQSHARRPITPPPPPVTSRGVYTGRPLNQKTRAKAPRRQYYYTLSTPGAEVRLPSLPAVTFGWRAVSAVISLLLLAAVFALWNAPQFQIEKVRVLGAKRISADEILTILNAEGLPIIEANPAEMVETMQRSFPDLSKVSVQVGLPARLVVSVTERIPAMAWEQDGKVTWIDQDGFAFPPRGDAGVDLITIKAEGAPVLSAAAAPTVDELAADGQDADGETAVTEPAAPQAFISAEMIEAIAQMSPQVPAGQSITYSPSYGLGWTDPQGWKVYFGKDIKEMDLKLKQYQSIVNDLNNRGIKPSMISVEFLHAPFYRPE